MDNSNSDRIFYDVDDAVGYLADCGEDVTWWGFLSFVAERLDKWPDIDSTRDGTEAVVRDPGALEGAMLATLRELLSDNGASFDGNECCARDRLVWTDTLVDAPELHDEQAQVCCGCRDVVLEVDPYSGLPAGTTFVDGEGWQCADCGAADPVAAMSDELAVRADGGGATSDITDIALAAGWVVADLRRSQIAALREAGQPYLVIPVPKSQLDSGLADDRVTWPRKSDPACAPYSRL